MRKMKFNLTSLVVVVGFCLLSFSFSSFADLAKETKGDMQPLHIAISITDSDNAILSDALSDHDSNSNSNSEHIGDAFAENQKMHMVGNDEIVQFTISHMKNQLLSSDDMPQFLAIDSVVYEATMASPSHPFLLNYLNIPNVMIAFIVLGAVTFITRRMFKRGQHASIVSMTKTKL